MRAATGTKYFALAFDSELVVDEDGISDWPESAKYKHTLIVEALEKLVHHFDGRCAAVTADGQIEDAPSAYGLATDAQAAEVLATLRGMHDKELYVTDSATLYEPGYHANDWTIAWEEGPENWVQTLAARFNQPHSAVRIEPISNWCVAILPNP